MICMSSLVKVDAQVMGAVHVYTPVYSDIIITVVAAAIGVIVITITYTTLFHGYVLLHNLHFYCCYWLRCAIPKNEMTRY